MAVISAGKGSKGALGSLKYVVFEKKSSNIRVKLVSTINCSTHYKDAANDFKNIAAVHKKDGGREAHHMVLSFSKTETEKFNHQQLMDKAVEITTHTFPNHQVWLGLHTDTNHPHVHLIINSVNLENGKKLQIAGRKGMYEIMDKVQSKAQDLGLDTNLSVGKKKERSYGDINSRNTVELKVLNSNQSWKKDIALNVISALQKSDSTNAFIMHCANNGISCDWNPTKKHITFHLMSDPSKKVRASNLAKTFTLPELSDKDKILNRLNENRDLLTNTQQIVKSNEEKKNITRNKSNLYIKSKIEGGLSR